MALDVYRSTLEGRSRTWTVDFLIPNNATVDIKTDVIQVVGNIKITYGSAGSLDLGEPVLSSRARIQLLDDDSDTFLTALEAADNDQQVEVEIYSGTGAASWKWHGFVVLDTIERKYFPDLGKEVIDLFCNDGLALIKDHRSQETTDYYVPERVAKEIRGTNSENGIIGGKNLYADVIWDISDDDFDDTAQRYAESIELDGYMFMSDKGENRKRREIMDDILKAFDARLWQQMYNRPGWTTRDLVNSPATLGKFPRWGIVRRRMIGKLHDQGLEYQTECDNAGDMLTGYASDPDYDALNNAVSVDADDFYRMTKYSLRKPNQYTIVNTSLETGDDNDNDVTGYYYQIQHFPTSTGWTTTGSFTTDGGADVIRLDATASPSEYGETDVVYLSEGARVKWTVFWQARKDSGSGNHTVTVSVRCNNAEIASVTHSAHLLPTTYVNETETIEFTATDSGLYSLRIADDSALGGTVFHYYKDIHIKQEETDWTGRIEQSGVTSSVTREFDTPLNDGKLSHVADFSDRDTNDDKPIYYQVEQTGTKYYTFEGLFAGLYDRMSDDVHKLINGEIIGLYPPEIPFVLDTKRYIVASGLELDLKYETTRGTWVESLDAFS